MSRPVYLIDCDGPLADFIGGVLPILSSILGREVAREEIAEFDIVKSLKLTAYQASSLHAQIDLDEFAGGLSVVNGSWQALQTLRKSGRVVVVTAPWPTSATWAYDRAGWLNLLHVDGKDIVSTRAKDLVCGSLLLDDHTPTLTKWQAAHPTGKAIQWATPHNRRDGWTGPSVSNWTDAIQMIAEMGLL